MRGKSNVVQRLLLVGIFLVVLAGCKVEIDHFFNEDGSLTFQTALGAEIDPDDDESITCETGSEQGFEIAYANLEERGSETWCTTGIPMATTSELERYYNFFNEEDDFLKVNCLAIVDGLLVYDIELLLDDDGTEEGDSLLWRVTAPTEIVSTNADSESGNTAVWQLVGRSGWVSMRINTDGTTCPTADFTLDLVAQGDVSGTAFVTAAKPSTGEQDAAALGAALTTAGWQVSDLGDEFDATRTWADSTELQQLAASLPMLVGSDLTVSSDGAGQSDFAARLDLSFYEAFWQGINPEIGDPSFRFTWTPLDGDTQASGDWTDPTTLSFNWDVDAPGRIFNMAASSEATAAGAGSASTGDDAAGDTDDEGDGVGGEGGEQDEAATTGAQDSSESDETTAGASSDDDDDDDDDGGVPVAAVVAGGAAVAAAAGGALEARRRRGKGRSSEQPQESDDSDDDDDDERRRVVSLELTYPAGQSPFVFQYGWIFGARCIVEGSDGQQDISDQVRWSGSAKFSPPVGRTSRPGFICPEGNPMGPSHRSSGTIKLSVEVDGERTEKQFQVGVISSIDYARVGDQARAVDAHGCPACPHTAVGPITAGSSTVLIDGLPAARVGDPGRHAVCCGPNTYTILGGDPTVLIDGRAAAKLGSPTQHCGGVGEIISASGTGSAPTEF